MLIYEVLFKNLNGMQAHELFSDKEKATDYAAQMARNYDETIVYEYIEKDGKFFVTKSIMHLGDDVDI